MKHTKLLKSAVLSTALLWGGATQAQTTGDMGVTIAAAAPSLTINAGAVSFGSHSVGASTPVLSCPASGSTTLGSNKVTDGSCGEVTVNAISGTVNYTVGVSPTTLGAVGQSGYIHVSALSIYSEDDRRTSVGATVSQSVTQGTARTYYIGGALTIPANLAAGTYTGTYTFTATVS